MSILSNKRNAEFGVSGGSKMKCFDRFHRQKIYEGLFSARALCIAGLITMPALLFNPLTSFRVVQFLFFWFLCLLAGCKTNPLTTILVISCIVACNLIMPYGLVLCSIGTFDITQGALTSGINRAVTLSGLITLSRLSIRPDLKIPGGFGALVGESFRFFALIISRDSKKRITMKNLMGDIDRLLIELSGEGKREATEYHRSDTVKQAGAEAQNAEAKNQEIGDILPAARTKASGFIILATVVIISWLLLALPLVSQSFP